MHFIYSTDGGMVNAAHIVQVLPEGDEGVEYTAVLTNGSRVGLLMPGDVCIEDLLDGPLDFNTCLIEIGDALRSIDSAVTGLSHTIAAKD